MCKILQVDSWLTSENQEVNSMKVVERIFEDRIRQQIDIDDMQFGFMKGI